MSQEAWDFVQRFDSAAPGTAGRQRLLETRHWPQRGPREAQLVETAARETIQRGGVMFLGAQRVALPDALATESMRHALAEAAPSAEIVRLSQADPDDKATVRVLPGEADYFAGGEVAIVPVTLQRGRPWSRVQMSVCLFARGHWVFHGVAEDG